MFNPICSRQIIDNTQFNEMRDLLEDDFKGLMLNFIEDSQLRIQLLNVALAQNDNATAFEVAHTLKGASANIGATGLVERCDKLLEACRQHQLAEQSGLINDINDELNLVQQAIHQKLGL